MSSIVNALYRFLKCQDQEGGSRRIFGSLLFRSRRLLRIFVYLMYVVYNCGGRRIPIIFKNAKWKCLASSEDQRKHGTPQGVCQMVVWRQYLSQGRDARAAPFSTSLATNNCEPPANTTIAASLLQNTITTTPPPFESVFNTTETEQNQNTIHNSHLSLLI